MACFTLSVVAWLVLVSPAAAQFNTGELAGVV